MKSFLLIITFFIISTPAIKIDCEFNNFIVIQHEATTYDEANPRRYACKVKSPFSIWSIDDRTVTEIVGTHLSGKSNRDVLVFMSEHLSIEYLPLDLTKFFPNIEYISIKSGNFRKFSRADLRPFGAKLKGLILWRNLIKTIEYNAFKYTPNIEYLDLDNNQITYVAPNTLTMLSKLKNFYIQGNDCADTKSNSNFSARAAAAFVEANCRMSDLKFQALVYDKFEELESKIGDENNQIKHRFN
jgi:Leucine-rich repeat (LRR) protein